MGETEDADDDLTAARGRGAEQADHVEELQNFMRDQGGLDYEENLDPALLVATEYAAQAASCLG